MSIFSSQEQYRLVNLLKRTGSVGFETKNKSFANLNKSEKFVKIFNFFGNRINFLNSFRDKILIPPGLNNLKPEKIQFLSTGNEHEVYALDLNDDQYVLKINYKIGFKQNPLESALGIIRNYQKIKNWYSEIPEVFPEEYFAISEQFDLFPNFLRKDQTFVLLIFQRMIDHPFRDVFNFSSEELSIILKNNPSLKREFTLFIKKMIEIYETDGCLLDIQGRNNLVVHLKENPSLLFLDTHSLLSKNAMTSRPLIKESICQRIIWSKSVLSKLDNNH